MFSRSFTVFALTATCLALIAAACGDGGNDKETTGTTTISAGRSPSADATTPAGTYTLSDAESIINDAPLVVDDLPDDGWTECKTSRVSYACVLTDQTIDNSAALAADPAGGPSFERCGRLLGRTLALQVPAAEAEARYAAGQTVSFFTSLTVYAKDAGAADCAAEAAVRSTEPGALARPFGSVFIDPSAVIVTPVSYPVVGDGSFAATLSGKILVAGVESDLTVLIVAFRKGNVTAVVGSAAASAPSIEELSPLVDVVIGRVGAAQ